MNAPEFAQRYEASARRCLNMDAPLNVRLKALADDVRSFGPDFAAAVDRAVSRLEALELGRDAPRPGDRMPDFMLSDQRGRLVSLADVLADGPAVIVIDRGHWCPYCLISVNALARVAAEMARAGGRAVVITPDIAPFARKLAADAQADFPVLTDLDNGYALQLGLLVQVEKEKRQAMAESNQDLAAFQGNDSWMFPIPATFVVRRDGIIAARFIDPDYRKRMEIDELIAAVRAAAGH